MAGGGGMAGSFIELGDKLHKNISSDIGMFSDIKSKREAQEQQQRQFEERMRLERDKFGLDKLLSMQDFREKEAKMTWKKDFRNAMAGGF